MDKRDKRILKQRMYDELKKMYESLHEIEAQILNLISQIQRL